MNGRKQQVRYQPTKNTSSTHSTQESGANKSGKPVTETRQPSPQKSEQRVTSAPVRSEARTTTSSPQKMFAQKQQQFVQKKTTVPQKSVSTQPTVPAPETVKKNPVTDRSATISVKPTPPSSGGKGTTFRIPSRRKAVHVTTGPSASVQRGRGRVRDRHSKQSGYTDFQSYMQKNDFSKSDFSTLGTMTTKANAYFEPSDKCLGHTKGFLQAFWENDDNRELTVLNHQKKHKDQGGKAPVTPMCISFIDATIKDKEYCFISISSFDELKPELVASLKKFITQYNSDNAAKKDMPEFVLLHGKTGKFSNLVQSVSQTKEKTAFKTCAEKYYASCLTKLYLEHGENLRVTGVINSDFYPYQVEGADVLHYGKQSYSIDPTVTPPRLKDNQFEVLDDDTLVTTKPCCAACTKNKDAILTVFKTAQSYATTLLEEPKSVKRDMQRLETSPVRNSFATPTSLLPQFSVVCKSEVGSKKSTIEKDVQATQLVQVYQ